MLDKKGIRQLAYIVKIEEIKPIPNYDRVEYARVGGWWVIVRKDQFKVGDLAIYIEVDSKVPEKEPFMFLEKKHFKVKTQKMCKVISQGLLMHPNDFGWVYKESGQFAGDVPLIDTNPNGHGDYLVKGDFVTERLGITYAEAEDNIRKAPSADKYKKMAQRNGKLFSKQPFRWLMKRTWGKKLLFLFFGKKRDKKSEWPAWVKKTDEERIQNMTWILENKSPWIATEKIDGTSTTFTMKRNRFNKFDFFVCSRNVVFNTSDKECYYDTNVYLEMAQKYDIELKMKAIMKKNPEFDWITIQGETFGEGIQKRDYHLKEHQFRAFNYITSTDGRWNSVEASKYLSKLDIPWVPIIDENFILPDTVEELLNISTGKSDIDGDLREGLVFRSADGVKSFKAVSNEFLLRYHNN